MLAEHGLHLIHIILLVDVMVILTAVKLEKFYLGYIYICIYIYLKILKTTCKE